MSWSKSSGTWKAATTNLFTPYYIFPLVAYHLFIKFVLLSPRVKYFRWRQRANCGWIDTKCLYMADCLISKKELLINGTCETNIRHNCASKSCEKRDSLHSIPGRTNLSSTLIFFSDFHDSSSTSRRPDLQDISLAAVNFILTGRKKKHWYPYIKQEQFLNVIDMLEGDLEELPQVPHENESIRQREEL